VRVGGHTNTACLGGAGFYWPIAQVLAYAAIAAFYIRRSQAHGIGTRVRPYAIAGIIIAILGAGVTLWSRARRPGGTRHDQPSVQRAPPR
jgi:hypothetical protein